MKMNRSFKQILQGRQAVALLAELSNANLSSASRCLINRRKQPSWTHLVPPCRSIQSNRKGWLLLNWLRDLQSRILPWTRCRPNRLTLHLNWGTLWYSNKVQWPHRSVSYRLLWFLNSQLNSSIGLQLLRWLLHHLLHTSASTISMFHKDITRAVKAILTNSLIRASIARLRINLSVNLPTSFTI